MNKLENRIYQVDEVIRFQKNNEPFGELSNMATGFPLIVNDIQVMTNEALYQSCRFPNYPEIQQKIIEQKSPMAVKYISRGSNSLTRPDWESVKVNIMRWCLRVKLAQHWNKFGEILTSTGEKSIVEMSKIDSFWGAKLLPNGTLVGINVLGRLLMELREKIKNESQQKLLFVEPLSIPEFMLYSKPIKPVIGEVSGSVPTCTGNDAEEKPATPSAGQLNLPF